MKYYVFSLGLLFLTISAGKTAKTSRKAKNPQNMKMSYRPKNVMRFPEITWQLLNGHYEFAGLLMRGVLRKNNRVNPFEARMLLDYYEEKEKRQQVLDPDDIPLVAQLKQIKGLEQ